MKTVYQIPNGYRASEEYIFGWLRNYGLDPKYAEPNKAGDSLIQLPDEQVPVLLSLAQENPARFGNADRINGLANRGWK